MRQVVLQDGGVSVTREASDSLSVHPAAATDTTGGLATRPGMLRRAWLNRWTERAGRDRLVLSLLFLLGVAIAHPAFVPSAGEIGVWDEASYINAGRELVEGNLIQFTHNPAVGALYAATYLAVQASPYWLVLSCWIARLIFFGLIWLASALVGRALVGVASPFVLIALVTLSPAPVGLLRNGSDSLFAAMSGFALWRLLLFERTREPGYLWLCSLFLGIAALSRNEGVLLFLIMLVFALGLAVPARVAGKAAIACAIPFVAVVGGYLGIYALTTGDFTLGTAERSYLAFEQGQGMAFASSYEGETYFLEGQLEARRLFGTPEENNHSVLTAISRNPAAYVQRIPLLATKVVKYAAGMYGWHFALLCLAFAVRGIIELVGRRRIAVLAILLLWPAYAVLYVLLNFQASHLLIPFLTVFSLAAVGVSAVASNLNSAKERLSWSAALVALTILGIAAASEWNDLLAAPALMLVGLWLTWTVADRCVGAGDRERVLVACLLLLSVALAVRFGVRHTEPPVLGITADDRAAEYLRGHLPQNAHVGAWGPAKVWTAKMVHVPMQLELRSMMSDGDLSAWMAREAVEAIYVDDDLRAFEPAVWSVIQSQIGGIFEIAFDTRDRSDAGHEVLILVPAGRG